MVPSFATTQGWDMESNWIETGAQTARAVAGNGLWVGFMGGGAFALALVGERLLALALG